MSTLTMGVDDINKMLLRTVELNVPYAEVEVRVDGIDVGSVKDIEDLLAFCWLMCKEEEIYVTPHPLGRGWVKFDCGKRKVEINVHGDWVPKRTYVEITIK